MKPAGADDALQAPTTAVSPFHLRAADGSLRFGVYHAPARQRAPRGALLHVPAFGEEMNKSRRMVAHTAQALARHGHAVLLLDLFGCGDSDGELVDATWSHWLDDLELGLDWLGRQTRRPVGLWTHRAGVLLAGDLMARRGEALDLLAWQPVTTGRSVVQSLLRIKAASAWAGGDAKEVLARARADLASGRSLEVGGYELSASLAQNLERTTLRCPATTSGRRLLWLEVRGGDDGTVSAPGRQFEQEWSAGGGAALGKVVAGPAFWQTVEIEDAPALTTATREAWERLGAPGGTDRVPATPEDPATAAAMPEGRAPTADVLDMPADHERAIVFDCAGIPLVGVLSGPKTAREGVDAGPRSSVGVVIVVGGPQYRIGSHRQFVQWARQLAAAGFTTLRFDVRGMGDSPGALRDFLGITPDIGAAVDALTAAHPSIDRVVLCGLCDGASAALLYLHERADPRIAGLVLVNPWVRTAQTQARTLVRHYYLQRLRDANFWSRLARGEIATGALREWWQNWRRARAGSVTNGVPGSGAAYPDRMAAALERFARPTLVVLSGQDYTAKEFLDRSRDDPRWGRLLNAPWLQRLDAPQADHTFSAAGERTWLEAATVAWISARLGAPPAGR